MTETTILTAARSGDPDAFERLVSGHRRELQAHCYRMLGSLQDAEDALQETLVAAWRGIGDFEQPGREILSFASRATWTPLLEAGLVDELHLLVGGAMLAAGTPLFEAPVAELSLLDQRRIGANSLMLRYAIGAKG